MDHFIPRMQLMRITIWLTLPRPRYVFCPKSNLGHSFHLCFIIIYIKMNIIKFYIRFGNVENAHFKSGIFMSIPVGFIPQKIQIKN